MNKRVETKGWSMDNKVEWGAMVTVVMCIIGAFSYGADMDKRVAVMEKEIEDIAVMRKDMREIRDTVILLKPYMERKEAEDRRQWERIREIGEHE